MPREENIFGQQSGSHKKPEKMNWENLSEKENITMDGHTDRYFDDSGLRIRNFPVNMKLGELKPIWSSFV